MHHKELTIYILQESNEYLKDNWVSIEGKFRGAVYSALVNKHKNIPRGIQFIKGIFNDLSEIDRDDYPIVSLMSPHSTHSERGEEL